MQVVCLEESAFYSLVEQVYERLKEKNNIQKEKWISSEDAMTLLNIKSKTTLQSLRDTGKITFTQPRQRIILYDRESILKYLEVNTVNQF